MLTLQKRFNQIAVAQPISAGDDIETIKTGIAKAAGALTFIAGLNGGWLGSLLPVMAAKQHLPLEQAGLTVSLLCAGCFVTQIAGSRILGALGGKKSLILGSTFLCLGMLGLAFSKGLYLMLLSAFVTGLGTGTNSIAGHVCLLSFYRERGASALAKLNISYGVGALLAPQIVLCLLSFGYPLIFCIAAVLTVCTTFFLFSLPAMDRRMHIRQEVMLEEKAEAVESPLGFVTLPMVLMGLVIFLYVGLESATGTWLFTYMQKARHAAGSLASLSVTSLFLGLTLGRIVATRATVKWAPSVVTIFAMALALVAYLALTTLPIEGQALLALTLTIGIGLGPVYPSMVAQTSQLAVRPERAAVVTSMAISMGAVGGILMPGVTGQVLAHVGVPQAMFFIIGLVVACLTMFALALAAKNKCKLR